MRDHGRNSRGEVVSWGTNCRLDNLQAAFLNFRLSQYKDDIKRRREIAQKYHDGLSSLNTLKLPQEPKSQADFFAVFQNYEIEAEKRDYLKQYLNENGIGTLIQWGGKAIHQWEHLGFNVHLPKAESFFKKCIMLPMNMFITNDDVDFICQKIKKFYQV